jgi:archaemetzincin
MGWRIIRITVLLSVGIFITLALCGPGRFSPPSPADMEKAIGSLSGLSEAERRVYDAADFQPLGPPGPADWLSVFPERGQTYDQYLWSNPNLFRPPRNKIYLQPLGDFPVETSPSLEVIREFTQLFFCAETNILPKIDLKTCSFTSRSWGGTGKIQLLTTDILNFLKERVPDDAYCLIALTMEDLYPDPSWNFVFGEAFLKDRAGVFSFARYDPAFSGFPRPADFRTLMLKRSCKVLAHETAHMFGMYHCTFFDCLVNGSNHLRESDARPMHLCPVCLRKLQTNIRFDLVRRYEGLEGFCQKTGMVQESSWLRRRIGKISPGK